MLKKPTAIGVSIVTIIAAIVLVVVLEWRGRQPGTPEETEDVVLQGDLNMQNMQETLTDQINSLPPSEARERMESETGLALSRLCIQWTEVQDIDPSEENLMNRDRACGEFRDYVDNGTLPAGLPSEEEPAR